jgi:predicted Zn-dependent protease
MMRRYPEAIENLRRAKVLTGDSPEVESALGVALAAGGDTAAAAGSLALLSERARTRYVSPVLMAQAHLALGDTKRALEGLEEGYRIRATEIALLDVRPVFAPLRSRPEFADLLQRIRHDRIGVRSVP